MNKLCMEAAVSQEYQEYIVEYYGDENFLTDKYGEGCYQIISERFAIAYVRGKEVSSNVNNGAFFIPACYGLMSSEPVLASAGITKVRNQPNLSMYGQGVMVGFIDTGDAVRKFQGKSLHCLSFELNLLQTFNIEKSKQI